MIGRPFARLLALGHRPALPWAWHWLALAMSVCLLGQLLRTTCAGAEAPVVQKGGGRERECGGVRVSGEGVCCPAVAWGLVRRRGLQIQWVSAALLSLSSPQSDYSHTRH